VDVTRDAQMWRQSHPDLPMPERAAAPSIAELRKARHALSNLNTFGWHSDEGVLQ